MFDEAERVCLGDACLAGPMKGSLRTLDNDRLAATRIGDIYRHGRSQRCGHLNCARPFGTSARSLQQSSVSDEPAAGPLGAFPQPQGLLDKPLIRDPALRFYKGKNICTCSFPFYPDDQL